MATELLNLWDKSLAMLEAWEQQRTGNNQAELLLASIAYALLAQRETWVPVERNK